MPPFLIFVENLLNIRLQHKEEGNVLKEKLIKHAGKNRYEQNIGKNMELRQNSKTKI